MKSQFRLVSVLAVFGVAVAVGVDQSAPDKPATSPQISFSLKDVAGRQVALADFKDCKAVAIVFTGTECPVSNYYLLRLKELHTKYAPKGVQFLAINSLPQDSTEDVARHAKQNELPFPVLKDADQKVADLLKAERTPEVVLLDSHRTVCYRGRIDDQYGVGYRRGKPNRNDLVEALDEVLAGKPVSVARTPVAGCLIGRSKTTAASKITYSNQIARLFQDRCQECHRPGEIGPFSLTNFDHAKGWADMIRETVSGGRMPPWYADPRYSKFANDRRLSKEEKETLLSWIDQGCAKGDDKDLPPVKEWAEGWGIGKPDAVITMQEDFTVPADGGKNGIPYKFFSVPTNFSEDKWIMAAEARPGNRSVVHHIICTVSAPGERTGGRRGDRGNYIVGVAPGEEPLVLPPGMGKKIPKGANINFQMHYTANGVEQKDRSSLGLIFCKEPPKQIVRTAAIANAKLDIPAGDANYQVGSSATYDKDTVILNFMPHMHLRGKDFEYRVQYPDGRSEIVLSVPHYDFAWQMRYVLAEPLRIPAGSKIVCNAHFDNSKNNPNNPDPTIAVGWGPQTWDEMMIGWMQYYQPEEKVESKQQAAK